MEINREFIEKRPLSYSSLKAFSQSPQHYIAYLQKKFEPTPAMLLGSIVDCLILTPDRFEEQFVFIPEDINRRTKDGKAQYEKFMTENRGKSWIDKDNYDEALIIADKVRNNPISSEILSRITKTQAQYNWRDKETDLPIISKMDGEGDGIILELKTTSCADPDKFMRSAYEFNYPMQAGIYKEGVMRRRFQFPDLYYIAVETKEPYGVCVLRASDDYIEYGKQEFRKNLQRFRYCLDKNLFYKSYEFKSSLESGQFTMDLPAWAKRRLDD